MWQIEVDARSFRDLVRPFQYGVDFFAISRSCGGMLGLAILGGKRSTKLAVRAKCRVAFDLGFSHRDAKMARRSHKG